ncbi:MAG: fatty acyl-AMP ligase [Gammaproteobacteria bacterium]
MIVKQDVTITHNSVGQNLADFASLAEALDYAATGVTGANFYDARCNLTAVLPYSELRQQALENAARLTRLGLQRGDHVALVADTGPDFMVLFFACQYAGLVPFAMPVPANLGSHSIYVQQLQGLLIGGDAKVAIAHKNFFGFLQEAAQDVSDIKWLGTPEQLADLPATPAHPLVANAPDEPAYLQFTSGSTRFPQGVVITGHAVMNNLRAIVRTGLAVTDGDRCASWLPFYHDMGLVGFVLGPIVSQLSVDYLPTRDFAIRPLQWLRLISRNRCTIAFAPPFGYELCARRIRTADLEKLDLGCWRIAGVGAEMIRPGILDNFAEVMADTGFSAGAFLPCYGLAEASLAVSFSELDKGLDVMHVDALVMAKKSVAVRVQSDKRKINEIVNCGRAIPGHEIKIVNDQKQTQPDLRVGRVLIRGPSLMSRYLNGNGCSTTVLQEDGWLDTGDLGYLFEDNLYLTGRRKDIIIVNGRNIRAQDLEDLAEQQPEVRMGDASAFGISDDSGEQTVVLVVECRLAESTDRQTLINRLQKQVYQGFGIRCYVDLVPPHTLPRTSSGKLSRVAARKGFIERVDWHNQTSGQSDLG